MTIWATISPTKIEVAFLNTLPSGLALAWHGGTSQSPVTASAIVCSTDFLLLMRTGGADVDTPQCCDEELLFPTARQKDMPQANAFAF